MENHTELVHNQPKSDIRDYAYAIVKGAISSIPFPLLPGIASEVLSLLIASPLSKRQAEWMDMIVQGLIELQEKVEGFRIEDLSDSDNFVTMVLQATQVALRNHQEEKLDALRNAVLNSALPNSPDDDVQLIFLNMIDSLTTWHLRLLALFNNPTKWAEANDKPFPQGWYAGGVSQVIEHAYPELARHSELLGKIVQDLRTEGLADIPIGTMMTRSGMIEPRSSGLGKRFLAFISTPKSLA